jgi:hypothetical protein
VSKIIKEVYGATLQKKPTATTGYLLFHAKIRGKLSFDKTFVALCLKGQ